jgi:hypothetical protein
MLSMLVDPRPAPTRATGEQHLRRQIDLAVSRALVDAAYADVLLADPTRVLQDQGCSPQHYRKLRGIRATSLVDFACRVQELFWTDRAVSRPLLRDGRAQLAMLAY